MTYQAKVQVGTKCRGVGNCRNTLYPFLTTYQLSSCMINLPYCSCDRMRLQVEGSGLMVELIHPTLLISMKLTNVNMRCVPSSLDSCSLPSSRRCVPGSRIPHLSSGQRARSSSEYRRSIFISAFELADEGGGR